MDNPHSDIKQGDLEFQLDKLNVGKKLEKRE